VERTVSAPLKLDSDQLRALADFLAAITEATKKHGVRIDSHQAASCAIGDNTLNVRWDEENSRYVVDDYAGQ
jgi:hypothetical protein